MNPIPPLLFEWRLMFFFFFLFFFPPKWILGWVGRLLLASDDITQLTLCAFACFHWRMELKRVGICSFFNSLGFVDSVSSLLIPSWKNSFAALLTQNRSIHWINSFHCLYKFIPKVFLFLEDRETALSFFLPSNNNNNNNNFKMESREKRELK